MAESPRSDPWVTPDYASLFYSKKINLSLISPHPGEVTPRLNSPPDGRKSCDQKEQMRFCMQ